MVIKFCVSKINKSVLIFKKVEGYGLVIRVEMIDFTTFSIVIEV